MNNFLAAILNGVTAAATHWQALFGILLVVATSQLLLYWALKGIFGSSLSSEEYFSLSLAGWILPASLIALIWYGLGLILSPRIGSLILVVIVLIAGFILYSRTKDIYNPLSAQVTFSLLLMAVFFLILRLAFVAKAVFPMYFDSAQHYQITREILATLDPSYASPWTLATYYHLGFHFLAAFFSFVTKAEINDIMLLLGQVILAVMPFSAFFIIKHSTRSTIAALFALLLAAFGWYMPAHAMDWGKYPALTGIALLPFVLSAADLLFQNIDSLSARKFVSLSAILVLTAIISVFLHSRVLIVFVIVALTWVLTYLWQKLPGLLKILIFVVVTAALIYEIFFIQTKGILGPLFDPYGLKAIVVTSSVLLLSIFAYRSYPAVVFSCIVAVLLLLVSLFIPLRNLFLGSANITLLDRPFVEMILYLPLTLLGGLGLAGLERFLQDRKTVRNIYFILSQTIGPVFILAVAINALFQYDLYPADCCSIVSSADLEAIDWMNNTLPEDARILISSTELNVLPTDEFQGNAGGDAGIWITPLINRPTVLMPYNTDFHQQQTLDAICQSPVDYVYVGEIGSRFDDAGMTAQPDKYNLLFYVPNVKIYQVVGCPK
ncbi:MAG TPA: hypothetical protein VK909_01795 [Anaerolineales bacterium]|nr:hypothetical protein [Anaerolineales bacterium]